MFRSLEHIFHGVSQKLCKNESFLHLVQHVLSFHEAKMRRSSFNKICTVKKRPLNEDKNLETCEKGLVKKSEFGLDQ